MVCGVQRTHEPRSRGLLVKYRTIVADPPWEIARRMGAGGRRARATEVPYEFMALEAICELRLPADDDAHLYLWSTRRIFREGIACQVARAWGFEPCGEIIWGLRNPGMGTRAIANDHEPVLVARRGSLPFTAEEPMGVHWWKQPYTMGKVHSAKPEAFLDLVEQVSPGPYLELFARRQRLGWDTWGNEALEHIEMGGAS
jgi:N6-adenosine-specific RNA methylase IME4